MTGAPVWALWTTNLVWDMATYTVTLILILISFMALDPRGYFTIDKAPGNVAHHLSNSPKHYGLNWCSSSPYCHYIIIFLGSLLILIFHAIPFLHFLHSPGALVLLLLVYGWGSIPLAYLFSFPFQTAAAGFAVLTFICLVAGEKFSLFLWHGSMKKKLKKVACRILTLAGIRWPRWADHSYSGGVETCREP